MLLWFMRALLALVLAIFLWLGFLALTGPNGSAKLPTAIIIAVTLSALLASFSQNPTVKTTGTIVGALIAAAVVAMILFFGGTAVLFKDANAPPLRQFAENGATPWAEKPQQLPLLKGKTGTDDDSVRPVNPALQPHAIAPRPLPQLPSNARIGTDDDSVRPLPPQVKPVR